MGVVWERIEARGTGGRIGMKGVGVGRAGGGTGGGTNWTGGKGTRTEAGAGKWMS